MALRLGWLAGQAAHRVEIGADAEVVALPREMDNANLIVRLERLQPREEELGRLAIDRVLLVGTGERDSAHDAPPFDPQMAHARASGRPSRRASASGTSIIIRNSAVEKTFPCASVLRESVPPPSSAPCKRKLSALRLGISYRSTSPVITPRKCSRTRSRVTYFSSSGYHSGRRAMTPTFAVSPLSPERACATSTSCTRITRPRPSSARRACQ